MNNIQSALQGAWNAWNSPQTNAAIHTIGNGVNGLSSGIANVLGGIGDSFKQDVLGQSSPSVTKTMMPIQRPSVTKTMMPIQSTPTPTMLPSVTKVMMPTQNTGSMPPFHANAPMILAKPIPAAQSMPYIQKLLQSYNPNSPLATPHGAMLMAQAAEKFKLHPALLPLLAIQETGAMKPAQPGQTALAAANTNANPFNVLLNGQEFDYRPMGGLDYSIPRYAQDITQAWTGQGWNNFRQNPTLQNFIAQGQNPSDNPQGEIQGMIQNFNTYGQ